jgi:hypothetical protein
MMVVYSPTPRDNLDERFTYHAPKGDQEERYESLRGFAKQTAKAICTHCPDSREKSLALTNIEQAMFWANAAIARNE